MGLLSVTVLRLLSLACVRLRLWTGYRVMRKFARDTDTHALFLGTYKLYCFLLHAWIPDIAAADAVARPDFPFNACQGRWTC